MSKELEDISLLVSARSRDSGSKGFGTGSLELAMATLKAYAVLKNQLPNGYNELDLLGRLRLLLGPLKPENTVEVFKALEIGGKESSKTRVAVRCLLDCSPQVLAQINHWDLESWKDSS